MQRPTHVSPSDIALFTSAQAAFAQAQAVMNFAGNHLASTYGLGERDSFSMQTGEISRFEIPNTTEAPDATVPPQGE